MVKVWPQKRELLTCLLDLLSHLHRRHIRDRKYSTRLRIRLNFFPTVHQCRYSEPKRAVILWLLFLSTWVPALCDLKLRQFSSDVMIQPTKYCVLLRCSVLRKLRTLSLLAGTSLVLPGNAWVERLWMSTTKSLEETTMGQFQKLAVQRGVYDNSHRTH